MSCSILVDSCSYFRLAQSINPLLKTPFCEEKYTLGVIKELNQEHDRNPTLQHKFYWVDQAEYRENRQRCFSLNTEQKSDIKTACYFIRETGRELGLGASPVDIKALAYCHVLNIPIVSDDADMLTLAKEYELQTYTSLELLRLLLDCAAIDMKTVRTIASYWIYQNDTPKSYKQDYTSLFSEPAPS
ncbi:MAG TPA: DNA-binding protein [Desulfobulbus sp.]|nr:DNA-binding protein [Desulfobulbus sp.]